MNYVQLSITDLVLAAILMLASGALSWGFSLKLERTLLLNSLRMVVQLALIGFVLKWIFAQTSPLWTIVLAFIMIAVAGAEIVLRQNRKLKGFYAYSLGTGTMMFIGVLVTIYAVKGIIAPNPWYQPRFILPILGMVLGNTMTGVSLVISTFMDTAHRERTNIEARLAAGHPRFRALDKVLSVSLRTGLMPIINAMATTGLVSLPGMMTGQILAGADPVEAAKYQMMIMFVIAGATAMAVVIAGLGSMMLLTDRRHRLRLDRLQSPSE